MYTSFLNDLRKCTKLLENLEAIRLILNVTKEDHNCILTRKESNIKNIDLKQFLELNSFSLNDMLLNIDTIFNELNMDLPENLVKSEERFVNYYDYWSNYLLKERPDEMEHESNLLEILQKITKTCKEWEDYLAKEEDRGTESSYSDYSGDSTESSDDEEETSQERSTKS